MGNEQHRWHSEDRQQAYVRRELGYLITFSTAMQENSYVYIYINPLKYSGYNSYQLL